MTNSNDRTRWTEERLDQMASFIFANAEAIRENAEVIRQGNEQLTQVRLLTESNSRAIQALADRIAELALAQEEAREERRELREATLGIANLLASLDSDRPTILRKLNTIENKVDLLLQRENGEQPPR